MCTSVKKHEAIYIITQKVTSISRVSQIGITEKSVRSDTNAETSFALASKLKEKNRLNIPSRSDFYE